MTSRGMKCGTKINALSGSHTIHSGWVHFQQTKQHQKSISNGSPGEQRQEACQTITSECSNLIENLSERINLIQKTRHFTVRHSPAAVRFDSGFECGKRDSVTRSPPTFMGLLRVLHPITACPRDKPTLELPPPRLTGIILFSLLPRCLQWFVEICT